MDLGLGSMIPATASDLFLAKLSPTGAAIWAKTLAGGGNTQVATGITVDSNGNPAVSGYFNVSLNLGAGVINSSGVLVNTTFVAKYSGLVTGLNPANYLWSKILTGGANQPYAIMTDSANHVIATGYFQGTASIDIGTAATPNIQSLTNAGWADIFLLNLNP